MLLVICKLRNTREGRKKKEGEKVWRSTRERTCMIESRQRAQEMNSFAGKVVVMVVDVIYSWIIR